jgi:hypothetical protein
MAGPTKKIDQTSGRGTPVSFTHGDAQRINAAVQAHERGRKQSSPSNVARNVSSGNKTSFWLASFTGTWLKDTKKDIVIDHTVFKVMNTLSTVTGPANCVIGWSESLGDYFLLSTSCG